MISIRSSSAFQSQHPVRIPSTPHTCSICTQISAPIHIPSASNSHSICPPFAFHLHPIYVPSAPNLRYICTPYMLHLHPVCITSAPHSRSIRIHYTFHTHSFRSQSMFHLHPACITSAPHSLSICIPFAFHPYLDRLARVVGHGGDAICIQELCELVRLALEGAVDDAAAAVLQRPARPQQPQQSTFGCVAVPTCSPRRPCHWTHPKPNPAASPPPPLSHLQLPTPDLHHHPSTRLQAPTPCLQHHPPPIPSTDHIYRGPGPPVCTINPRYPLHLQGRNPLPTGPPSPPPTEMASPNIPPSLSSNMKHP